VNDCRNAEIRDQLPDLLHDRLSAGARATVLAHVDGCAECRDELELLRGVRAALVIATPRVDTSRIVSALPKPASGGVAPRRVAGSRWADWRIAAAITVLAVGGTSVALLTRGDGARPGASASITAPAVPVANAPLGDTASRTPEAATRNAIVPKVSVAESEPIAETVREVASGDDAAELGVEEPARLTRLNERQLQTLLNDIGQLKATPITEPEPVTIKVDPRSSSGASNMEIM
jgi:hypothetical protein